MKMNGVGPQNPVNSANQIFNISDMHLRLLAGVLFYYIFPFHILTQVYKVHSALIFNFIPTLKVPGLWKQHPIFTDLK